MDIKLELLFRDDRIYLNFWDPRNKKNLLCQVKDDGLFRFIYSTEECEELELEEVEFDPFAQEEISLSEFIGRIRKAMNVDEWMRENDDRMKQEHEEFMRYLSSPEFEEKRKRLWEEEENKDIWRDLAEEEE